MPPSEGMVVVDGKAKLEVNSILTSSPLFLQKPERMHDLWVWILGLVDALDVTVDG